MMPEPEKTWKATVKRWQGGRYRWKCPCCPQIGTAPSIALAGDAARSHMARGAAIHQAGMVA